MENLLIEHPEDVTARLRLPPRNLKQELKKEDLDQDLLTLRELT